MTKHTRSITPASCRPTEAPEVFGVSKDKIYDWAREGRITIYKDGGVSLVIVSEVLDFIRSLGDHLGDRRKAGAENGNQNKTLDG